MKAQLFLGICCVCAAFGYTVQVDVGDVQVRVLRDPPFLGYEAVTLKGGGALPVEPGQPALPAVVTTVALPKGTKIESVDVSCGEPVALPGVHRVMPLQEPTPFSAIGNRLTPPDATVYTSHNAFPGKLAYSFGSGNMGGYGVGSVVLAPVQYVPATGRILVYPILDFKVNLTRAGADNVYPKVRLDWIDRDIRESLTASVINPWEVAPPAGVRLVGGGDAAVEDVFPYVIVTNETMAEEAQVLADWKTKKGLKAAVVTTSYIEANYAGRDFGAQIRNCIKDYYENRGTQYVCLIGTDSIVPIRKVFDRSYVTAEGNKLVPTDNYYGCLDGNFNYDGDNRWGEYPEDNVDWVYDVYVGRIQVSSAAALAGVIDKTLCYEGARASTETNPYDYQNRVILAGAWADGATNLGIMMEYLRDTYLTSPHWSFTELWDDEFPGGAVFNASTFTAAMAEGKGLIAHTAHCNTTALGTNSGAVSNATLYGLGNRPKFMAFLYSVGCYASNTDYDDNCAASFVNAPEGGGVGFTCNTRYGWYTFGDPLNHYSLEFIKEYFKQFGAEDVYVSGKLLAFHKHPLQSYIEDSTYRYIYFELIHHGDPDIWIPTAPIGTPTVTYDDQIPVNEQAYEVHVGDATDGDVAGALVCVWKGDEVYGADTTDEAGNVSFAINPTTIGTMYLTVSAHNFRTFEADVGVGTSAITLTSFAGRRVEAGVLLAWTVSGAEKADYFNLYRRPVATMAAPAGGNFGAPAGASADASGEVAATTPAGKPGWTQVNAEPITGRSPYRYLDRAVEAVAYEYELEAVQVTGEDELGTTRVGGSLPVAFRFAVAPNPAVTTAKVMIDLPGSMAAKVSVYDLAGRRVATVVDRVLREGENAAALDVSGLAAGVYILRLEAGGRVAAKRLAVVH